MDRTHYIYPWASPCVSPTHQPWAIDPCLAGALGSIPAALPSLEFEYADFAVWEQAHARDDEALSWWVAQLRDAPELISLPLDWRRPSTQATDGSHLDVHLDRNLTERVVALCASTGATLNSALLAAWSALLLHLSQQADVVTGIPHSMRYCPTQQPLRLASTQACVAAAP